MRGGAFHNKMIEKVASAFLSHGWEVETEFCYRGGGVVTFFDVFAVKDRREIAVEVEMSVRHVVDNVRKARAVEVEVWVVVPSRRLKRAVERTLGEAGLAGGRDGISVALVGEIAY